MISKIKNYFLWEKECLKTAKKRISQRNRMMLITLQSAMIISYLGLLIFGIIKNGYSSFQALFAFMLIYMLLCLILILKTPSMSVGSLTYGVYIVTIFLCMYASSFVDPDYINSEAYIVFLLFPILYIDSSLRLDTVTVTLAVIYLYNILNYKTGKALALEAVNIVCFSFLGIAIGHFIRWRTLKGFVIIEKSSEAELRDALTGLPNQKSLASDLSSLPMVPQAVILIKIDQMACPLQSFGLRFQEQQLKKLGAELDAAAKEQGIDLYCCGCGIVGLVQPRMLEGVFQRLEPLHHVLSKFEFQKNDGQALKLHFGIGASLCEESIEAAFDKASSACLSAQKDGANQIIL